MKRSDLFTLLMLFCMLGAAVSSISAANWMPGLGVAGFAMALGLLAGTALAFSNFTSWMAHVTSFVYGVFVIGVIGGSHTSIPDAMAWRERVYLLMDKIIVWVREAMSNGTSRESLIFILILCALFWLLGYTAAWYSFRHRRIWHVILPAGVTLFSNIYYYAGPTRMEIYLIIYLVSALILLVESNLADREDTWLRERVRFTRGLRTSFTLAGVGIAAVALLFAWRAPSLATSQTARNLLDRLEAPYNDLLARWNRLFTTLQNDIQQTVEGHENAMTLGGPRNLTEDPVMDVTAPPMRYYWRAMTFDSYDGRTWSNTYADTRDVRPGEAALPLTAYQARLNISPQFSLYRGTDAIYAPGMPQAANVPATVIYSSADDMTLEVLQLRPPSPLLPGNRYIATGAVSVADAAQLRNAGRDYPTWVKEKYLQLPEISSGVRGLARNIVGQAITDYDKAIAIERWLRANITYDENLPAPPPGVEGSDYILFRTYRAYCTYYATAMIVMLRTQGVPARMATGYAQGEMNAASAGLSSALYNVKVKDAHAWVEVFFPQYGWVEFEPTGGQPVLQRPEPLTFAPTLTPLPQPTPTPLPTLEATPAPAVGSAATPEPPAPNAFSDLLNLLSGIGTVLLRIVPFVLGIGLLIAAGVLGLRLAESAGFEHLPPIQRSYAMLSRWATWMGIGHAHTPYEQSRELAERAPDTRAPAQTITHLYVENRFGSAPPEPLAEQAARTAWEKARRELHRTWLRLRLRRMAGRK